MSNSRPSFECALFNSQQNQWRNCQGGGQGVQFPAPEAPSWKSTLPTGKNGGSEKEEKGKGNKQGKERRKKKGIRRREERKEGKKGRGKEKFY